MEVHVNLYEFLEIEDIWQNWTVLKRRKEKWEKLTRKHDDETDTE
jgi:hypothetical protein